jgi:hypothetical protein
MDTAGMVLRSYDRLVRAAYMPFLGLMHDLFLVMSWCFVRFIPRLLWFMGLKYFPVEDLLSFFFFHPAGSLLLIV